MRAWDRRETVLCPACEGDFPAKLIEEHYDRIGGRSYRVLLCEGCGVTFSEPRQPVGPEWYEKAGPIRDKESRPEKAVHDWRFRSFLSENLPPGKLLDIGCGDGSFLRLAQARGFAGAGFDYERRMVELARARGLADVEAAEFSDYCARRQAGEFDYVTLFDVLEHAPESAKFLAMVKRLLKVGGHLAITLPNAERPLPWGREEHDFPPHHFTRWSAKTLGDFLRRNGFEIVRQDAGHLKLSYLADHFYFDVIMPRLLKPARALIFGKAASGTISELYEAKGGSGVLGDKYRRQRLVDLLKLACAPLTYACALILYARFRASNPRCGDCLYTLAKRIS